jgi:hypothetical protein
MKYLYILATLTIFGCVTDTSIDHRPTFPLVIEDHVGVNRDILHREIVKAEDALGIAFLVSYYQLPNPMTIETARYKESYKVLEDTSYSDNIHVILVSDEDDANGLLGFSTNVLDTNLVIEYPKYYNKVYLRAKGLRQNTLVHELGHLFGLKHTFADGSEWGQDPGEVDADEYNYMSYNCNTDNLTDKQRDIVQKWVNIRKKRIF